MLMADKAADPCTSLFQLACGGWLRSTVANATERGSKDLDNVSVMDERKTSIDKKIKGESLENVTNVSGSATLLHHSGHFQSIHLCMRI